MNAVDRGTRGDGRWPRLLLIGAGGQLGSELLRTLQPLGQVICTHHRARGASADLELDLSQPKTIRETVRRLRPDLVINAGGYTDVEEAERHPDLPMRINGLAANVLASEARRQGSGLVHYSTDYVFDGSGQEPWHEKSRPHPLNAYGDSKLAGEEAIRQGGVEHLIIRTSWVYGPRGRNFLLTMLRQGRDQECLRVVADQVGAPTPARMVAEVTAQILAQARGEFARFLGRCGGLLHVACQGETSWHGFATEIFRQARRHGAALSVQAVEPISSQQYAARARRPANSRLNCGRLRHCFGLAPPDWQTALELCLEEMSRAQGTVFGEPRMDDEPSAEVTR